MDIADFQDPRTLEEIEQEQPYARSLPHDFDQRLQVSWWHRVFEHPASQQLTAIIGIGVLLCLVILGPLIGYILSFSASIKRIRSR